MEITKRTEATDDMKTYETVMIPVSTGEEKEFAIMDEFDLEGKHYIAVSEVVGDEIREGIYIYGAVVNGEELEVTCIEDEKEFEKVVSYYEEYGYEETV